MLPIVADILESVQFDTDAFNVSSFAVCPFAEVAEQIKLTNYRSKGRAAQKSRGRCWGVIGLSCCVDSSFQTLQPIWL